MYLYEKKIIYLSLFQDGVKKASAGFARASREKDALVLDIHIKCGGIFFGRKYSLFLVSGSREIEWGTITGQHGKADAHRSFALCNGFAHFGEEEFAEKDIYGILIRLDGQCQISGYWQEMGDGSMDKINPELSAAGRSMAAEEIPVEKISVKEMSEKEMLIKKLPAGKAPVGDGYGENTSVKEPRDFLLQQAFEDKWEQLLRCYKNVHPFGDERVFLAIEPKDFIILQAPYQRLVNNSFLLHGFYNYKHMILGPDKALGGGEGSCFYLGVPGTYFEREKMVAVMFGFEGFECDGAVEIGKFGYYMRRVEL